MVTVLEIPESAASRGSRQTADLYGESPTSSQSSGWRTAAFWPHSLNPIFIILLAPIFGTLWIKLGSRKPPTPAKTGYRLLLAIAFLVLAWGASLATGKGARASSIWQLISENSQTERLGRVKQVFKEIPQTEHFVTIQNGAPGLARLGIVVNGAKHGLLRLKDSDEITVDVSASMVPGNNTITLIGHGEPGAAGLVMISDIGEKTVNGATTASGLRPDNRLRISPKDWQHRSDLNFTWGTRIE